MAASRLRGTGCRMTRLEPLGCHYHRFPPDAGRAEPDPELGGAINLVRRSLADAQRLDAAQRATAQQRASFEAFAARHGLNARSLVNERLGF